MRRRPLNDRRFGRRIRLAVRYKLRRGDISADQARRLWEGSKDTRVVQEWREALSDPQFKAPWLDTDPNVWTGINWSNLWDWLLDNWPTILRILLSLLVFLGEPPKDANTR